MKNISFFCAFWLATQLALAQKITIEQPLRFLALGDSYTIGQNVPETQRWPQQLFDSLAARGMATEKLRIVARTGWRTDDLANAIAADYPADNYNLVSLLIGVNDQFQGKTLQSYRTNFEELLKTAMALAGGKPERVIVLSIPDYAYTPFGQSYKPEKITAEIAAFNQANRQITAEYGIRYYNITPISQKGLDEPSLVATDNLHPSGLMYAEWVNLILPDFFDQVVTALPDGEHRQQWHIYPNPLSKGGSFSCWFPPNRPPFPYTLKWFDASGKLVYEQLITEQNALLSPLLTSGVFWVRLYSANTYWGSRQIIIK